MEWLYCYAHKDCAFRDQLEIRLTPLKQQTASVTWYDGDILPGSEWSAEIRHRLMIADIIILLISPDFMASEYCSEEMKYALERDSREEAVVIPILIRTADLEGAPFSKIQYLPSHGRPPITSPDNDDGWQEVVQGIRRVVEKRQRGLEAEKRRLEQEAEKRQRGLEAEKRRLEQEAEKRQRGLEAVEQYTSIIQRVKPSKPAVASILCIILALIVVAVLVLTRMPPPSSSCELESDGTGICQMNDANRVGLSDGKFVFNESSKGAYLKEQAAQALKEGRGKDASSDWEAAVNATSSDSEATSSDTEALIYREDQRVVLDKHPHVTFVIGTMFSEDYQDGLSSSLLQGAYLFQYKHNMGEIKSSLPGGALIRLLIANSGSQPQWSVKAADMVVDARKKDKTILGVLGWPTTAATQAAINTFVTNRIPIVSASATGDTIVKSSPSSYFFRVTVPNKQQMSLLVPYLYNIEKLRRPVIVTSGDSYSTNLSEDFQSQFQKISHQNQVIPTVNYSDNDTPATLTQKIQDAFKGNTPPDFLFFASPSYDDMVTALKALPSVNATDANGLRLSRVKIVMGSAGYELTEYPEALTNHDRLIFSSPAFPDTWGILSPGPKPSFFEDYKNTFNPNGSRKKGSPYGFSRPNAFVMLSYDAMMTLLEGCRNALGQVWRQLGPDELAQGLRQITVSQPVYGVTGRIAFAANGDPVDKLVMVLRVYPTGHKLQAYSGYLNKAHYYNIAKFIKPIAAV
jgi:ABC-type branched-subunit amino acid transport system substrate-binding protein